MAWRGVAWRGVAWHTKPLLTGALYARLVQHALAQDKTCWLRWIDNTGLCLMGDTCEELA
jgi:hypothetical protein